MISTGVFITVVIATFISMLAVVTIVSATLGSRITDLGKLLGDRISGVEARMNTLEGVVRDVGERLTALETDLGKR